MKILFNFYHPVIYDLAQSFHQHLKFDCTISVNTLVSDHYGSHLDLLANNKKKYPNLKQCTLNQACVQLKQKQYDLVMLDGVYSGDKQLIDICKQSNLPYVCISGYPYLREEQGAKNVLSFSWFMPQIQFVSQFPTEGHVKQFALDTNRINTIVFYPEFLHAKKFAKENPRLLSAAYKNGYVSFIHRFEECNPAHWKHFKNIENILGAKIENYTNLTQEQVLFTMNQSKGLCLIKWADQPGIALLESMLLGVTPFVFQEYVLASFNQDILINNHSAIISDNDDEFVENLKSDKWATLSESTQAHANMITSFKRQRNDLEKFLQKALNNV